MVPIDPPLAFDGNEVGELLKQVYIFALHHIGGFYPHCKEWSGNEN